jgi:hypothetical protein
MRSRTAAARSARFHQITQPLRPATISSEAGLPGVEPGPARLELALLSVTPQAFESGRPGSNGPLRSGAPVLFRLSYVRQEVHPARVEPAASAVAGQRSIRGATGVGRYGASGRSRPAPRPYNGRVLSVDTTEAKVETAGVEPAPPRCKRGALPPELHPPADQRWGDADGWSRTTTARGTAFTARGAHQLLSVRMGEGGRPGSNRRRRAHNPGCFRLHHGHHEAGTTGLEPAASRLTSERSGASELRPQGRGGTLDRLPATGDRRCRLRAPEPAVAHRRSCQRVSAPPPPHRLALEGLSKPAAR